MPGVGFIKEVIRKAKGLNLSERITVQHILAACKIMKDAGVPEGVIRLMKSATMSKMTIFENQSSEEADAVIACLQTIAKYWEQGVVAISGKHMSGMFHHVEHVVGGDLLNAVGALELSCAALKSRILSPAAKHQEQSLMVKEIHGESQL